MLDVIRVLKGKPGFWKQSLLTLCASLAFLVIGLVRGYSSPALPSIEALEPDLIKHREDKSWIGSIAPLGAFCGSLLSGILMEKAGRKRSLMITTPLWAGAWLILSFGQNLQMLIAARMLCGIGAGLVLAPVQVYVSECTDADIRGRLGSLPTLFMSFGILLSYIMGGWLNWRQLAYTSSAFCVVVFLVLIPLPESPVWLKSKGKDDKQAIEWLHLAASKSHLERKPNDLALPEPPSLFTREVFFSTAVYKPLIVCFGLFFLQQLSGIDSIIFFTVEIFRNAGSSLDPAPATMVVGLVQLICNGVSTLLLDKCGRKPLLFVSSAVTMISMVAMGFAFHYDLKDRPWLGYLPVASLVLFMVGFSLGLGGIPFLLLGELFPAHYRSQLSALASAVNYLTMFSVIKSYHILQASISAAVTFWMYGGFCCLAFIFTLTVVPETKGKTLSEIEQHFRSKKTEKEELPERVSTLRV